MSLSLTGVTSPSTILLGRDKPLNFDDPEGKGRKIIWILRKPYSNAVTICYKDGSSDYLSHMDARSKLIVEGTSPKGADDVLNYCWNFYEAKVVIDLNKPHSLNETNSSLYNY